jgi:excinuclease UvrABC nuclease subunit
VLTRQIEFTPERDAAIFDGVPAAPAVFLLRGDEGSEPYVSKTADLKRRLVRLLGQPDESSRRLSLRERCRSIEYSLTGSDFESGLLLYKTLRAVFPQAYRERLKLRFAPLIKLNLENPYPRAYITRRISNLKGASRYYGPFPSRAAAEKFLNSALDFFKMRRCDFELNPDPAFPGCIYSEMKMCLAPCFKGCSDEEYRNEVAQVQAFLDSSGQSLLRQFSSEREQASTGLDFEAAATLHERVQKVEGILTRSSLPELVRPIQKLNGVVVQRSTEKNCVALFPISQGTVSGPVAFAIEPPSEKSKSMESRTAEVLAEQQAPATAGSSELNEHLALLKRWYYRSQRLGEIFLEDEKGELPLRRLVRGIGRVFRGEQMEPEAADSAAREYWLTRARETTDQNPKP